MAVIQLNVRRLRSFAGVVVGIGMLLTFAQGASGQVAYELLHAFTTHGSQPSLWIQASDGNFYVKSGSDGCLASVTRPRRGLDDPFRAGFRSGRCQRALPQRRRPDHLQVKEIEEVRTHPVIEDHRATHALDG